MSTAALTNLRDYLTGTLSPANMLWLSSQLAEYAQQAELKPYTIEELHERIALGEADIAAGKYTSHEESMRRWTEKITRKKLEPQITNAV